MRATAAGLLVAGWFGSAQAADLPRFDVALHCSSFPAGSGVAACERAELAARDTVIANWTSYPEQRKHFCLQSEKFRHKVERSYVNLSKCLDGPDTTS